MDKLEIKIDENNPTDFILFRRVYPGASYAVSNITKDEARALYEKLSEVFGGEKRTPHDGHGIGQELPETIGRRTISRNFDI